MTFREEFPDYPVDAFPAMPPSFVDTSWHNDVCPSITSDLLGFSIFVDYPDPAAREHPDAQRFTVSPQDHGVECSGPSFDTDDWNEVLIFLLAERFVVALRAWLTPAQFAEMKAKNETAAFADGCCASHDYCDANMAMDAAFNDVLGRSPRSDDESPSGHVEDTALWNAAWNTARKNHIGSAS